MELGNLELAQEIFDEVLVLVPDPKERSNNREIQRDLEAMAPLYTLIQQFRFEITANKSRRSSSRRPPRTARPTQNSRSWSRPTATRGSASNWPSRCWRRRTRRRTQERRSSTTPWRSSAKCRKRKAAINKRRSSCGASGQAATAKPAPSTRRSARATPRPRKRDGTTRSGVTKRRSNSPTSSPPPRK